MNKPEFTKTEKVIFKNLILDIKKLKKYSHYSLNENKVFYNNLCDTIIKAIKKTIKPTIKY